MDACCSVRDQLLYELRVLARRADWSAVRALGTTPLVAGAVEAELLVGEAELRQGATTQAKDRLRWVAAEAERLKDGLTHRRGTNMLGAAHFELGELEQAERAFDQALAMATRVDDHLTGARATNNLGMIANVRGRHDEALAHYRIALPAYYRLGFAIGLGETTHNIAITLRDLGQLEAAEREERRAIQYATDAGDRRLTAIARAGRAEVLLLRGDAVVARAEAHRAGVEFAALADPVSEADALRIFGRASATLGALAQAACAVDRAIALARDHESVLVEAESHWARAEIALAEDDLELALSEVWEARARFAEAGATGDAARLDRWWRAAGHED